jgi:hypothetical protein
LWIHIRLTELFSLHVNRVDTKAITKQIAEPIKTAVKPEASRMTPQNADPAPNPISPNMKKVELATPLLASGDLFIAFALNEGITVP